MALRRTLYSLPVIALGSFVPGVLDPAGRSTGPEPTSPGGGQRLLTRVTFTAKK